MFPHEHKVAAFVEQGYPLSVLPQQSGKPYLCEDFVLKLKNGQLCVALVDQLHRSPFMQLWRLSKRFLPCLEYSHERVWLLVAVENRKRFHYYRRIIGRHTFQKLAKGRFTIPVRLYRVQRPIQGLRSLRPRGNDPLASGNHEPEPYGSDWHGFGVQHSELE